jgi:hypothetical protein
MSTKTLDKKELNCVSSLLREFRDSVLAVDTRCSLTPCDFLKEFKDACASVREVWALAAFKADSDNALRRYFSYHLKVLSNEINSLVSFSSPIGRLHDRVFLQPTENLTEIFRLIDDLFSFYADYLNPDIICPHAYRLHKVKCLGEEMSLLSQRLQDNQIDSDLRHAILKYLDEHFDETPRRSLTYGSLLYLDTFLKHTLDIVTTSKTAQLDDLLSECLMSLNFNRIEFLLYRHKTMQHLLAYKSIKDKQVMIQGQLQLLCVYNSSAELSYDTRYPPIVVMVRGWLEEERLSVEKQLASSLVVENQLTSKIPLNISVAQLAYLIRLFFEEKLYKGITLVDLFKISTQYLSTTRQENISYLGLSNQYYAVTDVTAAVIRDLLKRMIIRIDQQFFSY